MATEDKPDEPTETPADVLEGLEAVVGQHGRTGTRVGPSQTHGLLTDRPLGRRASGRVRTQDLSWIRG
jgi:hypothetical protein